jgi:hypothetical protein
MSTSGARAEREIFDAFGPDLPVYAVLDGARDDLLVHWIRQTGAPAWCLYSGKLHETLEAAAPWLLRLGRGHGYTAELFARGWGESWGFFLSSTADARAIRRQLRCNLLARSQTGRRLVFRYYDPRVLQAYLPTCTPSELRAFLGPIAAVAVEREDEPALLIRHPDGAPENLPRPRPSRARIEW